LFLFSIIFHMANEHDKRNKKLFESPRLVEQLIYYFVDEDFVKKLNFSTLERMDKSFITDEFKEKEADIIYKVFFQDKPVYIYLLIEFQSTVDKFMALRINRYITEFYEYLTKQENWEQLPAVFPVLLYNGSAKWTAKTNLQDLVQSDLPAKYIPHFSYYKIIENEIPKRTLKSIHNIVSAVFYVENLAPGQLKDEVRSVIQLIEKENPDLIQLFRRWMNNLFKKIEDENLGKINDAITQITEVKNMFETALEEYGVKIKEEGIQQGLQRGQKIGVINTARNLKREGIAINIIAGCTGLSVEEIEEL